MGAPPPTFPLQRLRHPEGSQYTRGVSVRAFTQSTTGSHPSSRRNHMNLLKLTQTPIFVPGHPRHVPVSHLCLRSLQLEVLDRATLLRNATSLDFAAGVPTRTPRCVWGMCQGNALSGARAVALGRWRERLAQPCLQQGLRPEAATNWPTTRAEPLR